MFSRTLSLLSLSLPLALCSDNGSLYTCDAGRLSSSNECVFASASGSAVVSPHVVDVGVAPDSTRGVVDASGAKVSVSPRPWTQGDALGIVQGLSSEEASYARVFEAVAPLRNAAMFYPSKIKASATLWAALTKAMVDCKVKSQDTTFTRPDGTTATAYGVNGVYGVITDPKANGGLTPNNAILQFLEEGAIDLACLAAPSLTMDRCTTIRASNNVATGQASTCWLAGRDALYSGGMLDAELLGTSTTTGGTTTASTTATSSDDDDGLSDGAIAGIVAGSVAGVVIIGALVAVAVSKSSSGSPAAAATGGNVATRSASTTSSVARDSEASSDSSSDGSSTDYSDYSSSV